MKSILLDTNIFIRFLIKDIDSQFQQARDVFEQIEKQELEGLVSILVINEIIWILENFYEQKREVYIPKLLNLFALKHIRVIELDKDEMIKVLEYMHTKKFDFTDIYLAYIARTREIFSFDKDFEKIGKII